MVLVFVIVFFLGGVLVGTGFSNHFHTSSILPGSVFIVNKINPSMRGSASSLMGKQTFVSRTESPAISVPETPAPSKIFIPPPVEKDLISDHQEKISSQQIENHVDNPPRKQQPFDPNSQLMNSFFCSGSSYAVLPKNFDMENIVLTAWVRLSSLTSGDMRTIFTNKKSGCGTHVDQFGFSLYVNGWQTSDHKLYLEFGDSSSGCHKINSGSLILENDRWYHVAAAFIPDHAFLFVNGHIVGEASNSDSRHGIQSQNEVLLGQYSGGEYPLLGNLSHVSFYDGSSLSSSDSITSLVSSIIFDPDATNFPDAKLIAHFPLLEPDKRSQKRVTEVHNGQHGRYILPAVGSIVAGISVPLISGIDRADPPTLEELKSSDDEARQRSSIIRSRMKDVWSSYRRHAWGYDELKPLSLRGDNNWGGMSVTLVDALDTLWVMGLKDEFDEAVQFIKTSLTFSRAGSVSVFETTIRELGGLLSAYDLSQEPVLLKKAEELGNLLLPAFDTNTGIPTAMVNFQSHSGSNGWAGGSAILSELGSVQLEFRYLSRKTNRPRIEETVMKPIRLMQSRQPPSGLFPIKVSINDGRFTDSQVTLGALGDSFYEYLLKVWIQGGRKEQWLRDMYDRSIQGVMDHLLQISEPSHLAFFADWNGHSNARKMDHLVCFMPGLLALGAHTDPQGSDSPRAQRDLAVAKALMYTCREMYHRMESGISAEYVEFPRGGGDIIVPGNVAFYILRPETAESLFVMHQLTQEPIYRQWAWEIFTAIDTHCKTKEAYGSLRNVRNPSQGVDDRMESFFLAETMKYLYLVQDPDKPIDLDQFVFNTEAHPTRIFN